MSAVFSLVTNQIMLGLVQTELNNVVVGKGASATFIYISSILGCEKCKLNSDRELKSLETYLCCEEKQNGLKDDLLIHSATTSILNCQRAIEDETCQTFVTDACLGDRSMRLKFDCVGCDSDNVNRGNFLHNETR